MLEENVDEKYYLSEKTVRMFTDYVARKKEEGCGFGFEPTTGGGALNVLERDQAAEQTIILSKQGTKIERKTEVASACMARDYKGFGNQAQTGVIEWKK